MPEITPGERAAERRLLDGLDSCAEELYEFVSGAVRVPSVTGQEKAFGEFVTSWLHRHELETYTRTVDLGSRHARADSNPRPTSSSARTCSAGCARQLGSEWSAGSQHAPGRGRPRGEDCLVSRSVERRACPRRIWGRGSVDMKASIGAALFALRAVARSDLSPACDVELQCVVAEESGGLGTLSALDTEPTPSAAIVLEPSECVPRPACSGCVHFTVTVEGRSAHAATPCMGVSALDKLILAYGALQALAERRRRTQDHPLFAALPDGAPFSMGVVRAGEWRSSVAERAEMIGRFGVMPGESLADGRTEIVRALEEAADRDDWLREHPRSSPGTTPASPRGIPILQAPIVRTLAEATQTITGRAELGAVTFGSDAGHFATRGIPVVIFGPGRITDAHAPDESVEEAQILACAKALALAIVRYRPSEGSPPADGRS